jgi:hypothetical protein
MYKFMNHLHLYLHIFRASLIGIQFRFALTLVANPNPSRTILMLTVT